MGDRSPLAACLTVSIVEDDEGEEDEEDDILRPGTPSRGERESDRDRCSARYEFNSFIKTERCAALDGQRVGPESVGLFHEGVFPRLATFPVDREFL